MFDTKKALTILGLEDDFETEGLEAAYKTKLKEAKDADELEEKLLALNMARDHLRGELAQRNALVPLLSKEVARISAENRSLVERKDAKEEMSRSLAKAGRRVARRYNSNRDLAGLTAAGSAAVAIFRDNLAEVLALQSLPPVLSAALFIGSAYLAVIAFMLNRRAQNLEDRMDDLNRTLTRGRTIDRIIARVFEDSKLHAENDFEDELRLAIEDEIGEGWTSYSPLDRLMFPIGVGGSRGLSRILTHDLLEDYIEFLIKSNHVETRGTSGVDMVVMPGGTTPP